MICRRDMTASPLSFSTVSNRSAKRVSLATIPLQDACPCASSISSASVHSAKAADADDVEIGMSSRANTGCTDIVVEGDHELDS